MVMIFQRFTPYMWGVSQSDASKVEIEGQTYHLGNAPTKFELNGRRTSGAFAAPDICPNGRSETTAEKEERLSEDNMNLFFKCTYAECVRVKEPTVIMIIGGRIDEHMPVEFCPMVTDHIPTVIASQECNTETTATIRFFLDEVMGSSTAVKARNQERSRVRVWMITTRLRCLYTLTDPSEFWRAYWDIVRCKSFRISQQMYYLTKRTRSLFTLESWHIPRRHQYDKPHVHREEWEGHWYTQ